MPLEDEIEAAATAPKKASGDMGSVEQQSIPDMIEAAKHLAQNDGVELPSRGLRFTKLVPPGST